MFASAPLLLALTLAAASSSASFDATRARALKAYKARQFKRACALYSRAAKLNPEHAPVHADLGQCLARLGKKSKEAAERESARAVFLARPHREPLEPEDAPTRLAAYSNLFALGTRLELPKPGACIALPQAPECSRVVHACGAFFNEHGSAGGVSGEAVRLALSPTVAAARTQEDPETQGLEVERMAVVDFLPPEEGQDSVEPSGPSSLVLVTEAEEMFEDCGPRPRRANDVVTACKTQLSTLTDTRCSLVLADACAGVVGVVCETRERGKKARPERRVGEVVLTD
jgi:tetratricopeptide (TPR) repeat protein